MMTNKQKYNVAVVKAALELIERPGMTVSKLRDLQEAAIRGCGREDELDQAYYDALTAAIELIERPLFQ
jgi:hypothetical protein